MRGLTLPHPPSHSYYLWMALSPHDRPMLSRELPVKTDIVGQEKNLSHQTYHPHIPLPPIILNYCSPFGVPVGSSHLVALFHQRKHPHFHLHSPPQPMSRVQISVDVELPVQ